MHIEVSHERTQTRIKILNHVDNGKCWPDDSPPDRCTHTWNEWKWFYKLYGIVRYSKIYWIYCEHRAMLLFHSTEGYIQEIIND